MTAYVCPKEAGRHLLAVIKDSLHCAVSSGSHCWVDLATYAAAAAATGYLLWQVCWCCLQGAQDDLHDLQVNEQVQQRTKKCCEDF